MTEVVPTPGPDDVPFNDPYSADLQSGKKLTVRYEPEQGGSTFYLPILAISKHAGTIYEVRDDGGTTYGPSSIPPTDIDDMTVCWLPSQQFQSYLEVVIRNNSGKEQTYHVQPIGFERSETTAAEDQ